VAELSPVQGAPVTSLWALKPWWCQPWSILLTGVTAVGGSWWWLRLWWISLPLAAAVLLWWWLFLVVVPAAYRAEMAAADQGPAAAGDQKLNV
jgi:hypothetical protein